MITVYKHLGLLIFIGLISLALYSCSTTTRLGRTQTPYIPSNSAPIKVELMEQGFNLAYTVENSVILYNKEKAIAVVKNGNILSFSIIGRGLKLKIADSIFDAAYFQLKPAEAGDPVSYKGKNYWGVLKIVKDGNTIRLINQLPLEDYLKGVIPAEMPTGKDGSYFEALKAFAICARTYAVNRMNNTNGAFDIYYDTRDQAYGGADGEKQLASRAVDETAGLILTYNDKPARVYYHASCGGHTENVKYVFGLKGVPYLQGVQDGDPPNCSIASNFAWTEKYPENVFIERLRTLTFMGSKNYSIKDVKIVSRDESGRVSLLQVTLSSDEDTEKIIKIEGNKIRSMIRTANNNDILKSTMFDINLNDDKSVTITGKGNGHGVGLCQWGAIHQSVEGKSFNDIISFYFPGTEVSSLK